MANIRSYFTGFCMHPECMILPNSSWRKKHLFPSQSFVVTTSSGSFAWDTGYSQHFFGSMRGIYRLYGMVTPVHSDASQSLSNQLKKDGIVIDRIFLSHFHADHMAGLLDFPNVPVFASKNAWDSIVNKHGIRSLLQAYIPTLLPENIERNVIEDRGTFVLLKEHPELGLLCSDTTIEHGWMVDASGECIAVSLPGHAAGHMGLFVRGENGWGLIASDAAWSHFAYIDDELVLPHSVSFIIQDSKDAYQRTLKNLQILHRRGVPIHLSHERRSAFRMISDREHKKKVSL